MLGIELRQHSEVSLARQIYQALKAQIINGRLKPGEGLLSTRELAKQLAVSRNTVCEAYDMLSAEGFIISRQGAPTRIAEGLYLEKSPVLEQPEEIIKPEPHFLADFRTGQPDLRYFPRRQWLQFLLKASEKMPLDQLGYVGPQGITQLREEIAAWLFRSRGLEVNPQNMFITGGATQGLHLLADLISAEGKEILVEDPCHIGMLRVLQGKGYPVRPVPVDIHGMQTDHLEGKGACAVYVTPSHQFPLGGILPAGRRAALIRLARENSLYLLEDDYDSEFRYCGAPVAPLYSMDPQRVIYIGTFSKILFPALRIGYVVLPRQLHESWRHLRTYADVQNPPFEQAALAEYLHTRRIDRHVQQMRKLYGQRRQVLLKTLKETFGKAWRPWGDAAGLHLALEFPGLSFDHEFVRQSREYGIRVTTVEYHSISKGAHLDKLLLGYGHLEPYEIRQGILLLHEFMKKTGYMS